MPVVTLDACLLGSCEISYRRPHAKKLIFFFSELCPFLNYALSKKRDDYLVGKISQKYSVYYLIKYKGIRLSVSFVSDFRKVEFGQLQSLERLSVKEKS